MSRLFFALPFPVLLNILEMYVEVHNDHKRHDLHYLQLFRVLRGLLDVRGVQEVLDLQVVLGRQHDLTLLVGLALLGVLAGLVVLGGRVDRILMVLH